MLVRKSLVQTWDKNMLERGRRFYHKNFQRSLSENMAFGFIYTAGETYNECQVQSLGKIKQYAYVDCRDIERLYVFEDREVLVKYEDKNYGTVPAMMLTPRASGWMKYLKKKGGRNDACRLLQECEGYR